MCLPPSKDTQFSPLLSSDWQMPLPCMVTLGKHSDHDQECEPGTRDNEKDHRSENNRALCGPGRLALSSVHRDLVIEKSFEFFWRFAGWFDLVEAFHTHAEPCLAPPLKRKLISRRS